MRGKGAAWRPVFSALCAVLVGIGLARFAYTPLIPALIVEGWFAPAAAGYLGAANLAGYLAGALASQRMARHFPVVGCLRAMMVLAAVSLLACAHPVGFGWYFVWRFAAGVAGGVLMALAAPTALLSVPAARRGIAGGVVFTGVGLGIALSGTLVPLLLQAGLAATWIGLGLASLLLTVVSWGGWGAPERAAGAPSRGRQSGGTATWPLFALLLAYGLDAAGIVPHMVFIVDFVARGLERGMAEAGRYWVLAGAGAVCGPILAGWLADRIGYTAATRLALGLQAVAAPLPAITSAPLALGISCAVVGAFVPGIVPLFLGRVRALYPDDAGRQRAAWSRATAAFALGQAGAGYFFSWLFEKSGYAYLFPAAGCAMLLALAADIAGSRRRSLDNSVE